MVTYSIDFHENTKFSKTLSKYLEQPYPLLCFFIHLKKMHVTFVGYSWNNQGTFLYSVLPEHYLGIFPGISQGTFSKYSGSMSLECSTNIPRTIFPDRFLGIFPGLSQITFVEYSGNISWECSMNIPQSCAFPVGCSPIIYFGKRIQKFYI